MKTILGFITKNGYIDNRESTVSRFYELSPLALTYSRRRGEYQHSEFPGDTLHTFKTVDAAGAYITLVPSQIRECLAVNKEVLQYLQAATYPYDMEDFRNLVLARMGGKISHFESGRFSTGGTRVLPEWIGWRSVDHPDVFVKVWLECQAFEQQYVDYEVVVVPPLEDLDRFFAVYGVTAAALQEWDAVKMLEKTQDAMESLPASVIRLLTTTFINSNNPTQTTKVYWGVAIYGMAGDHIDSIKDAVIDYVLSHSQRTQPQWEIVMPDLFQRTEFLFQPRWDLISIPNLTIASALYSSMVEPTECMLRAREVWSNQSPTFVDNNLALLPFDYKAIMVMALNGQTNIPEKRRLKTLFPDYLPVPTSSLDFNRMSLLTREWVLMMVSLIVAAETATSLTTLPQGLRRVTRHGKRYIAKVYDNVNYLVATRLTT